MKNIWIILCVLVLITGCNHEYEYEGWKQVSISGVGTIKFPQSMVYTEKNDIIYITNNQKLNEEKSNSSIIGLFYEDDYSQELSYVLGEEIVYEKLISSETFSNSAIIGEKQFSVSGEIRELLFLDLYSSDKKVIFFVVDDAINRSLISHIGKSFVMDIDE